MNERFAMGLVAFGMGGCALDVGETAGAGEGAAPLARVEQALASSTVRNKRGVVEVEIKTLSKCTGVMINENFILTAADCADLEGEDQHYIAGAKAWYFDPDLNDGEKRLITEDTLGDGYDFVAVNYHRFLQLALIWRPDGWVGTSSSDYQRISLGTCDQIDKPTLYGRGTGSPGNGAGVLRSRSVDIDECGNVGFSDEGEITTCPGDLGGPYIAKAGQWDVVTGIVSNIEGGTPNCSNGGTYQFSQKGFLILLWAEDMMGYSCPRYVVDGHEYARCWE